MSCMFEGHLITTGVHNVLAVTKTALAKESKVDEQKRRVLAHAV